MICSWMIRDARLKLCNCNTVHQDRTSSECTQIELFALHEYWNWRILNTNIKYLMKTTNRGCWQQTLILKIIKECKAWHWQSAKDIIWVKTHLGRSSAGLRPGETEPLCYVAVLGRLNFDTSVTNYWDSFTACHPHKTSKVWKQWWTIKLFVHELLPSKIHLKES